LISGASVAGPALAYWLHRRGFEVTVVERAAGIRAGGYPVDVRGTAVDVVERMGLLSQVQAAHIDTRRLSLVDGTGRGIVTVPNGELTTRAGGVGDLELPRGELTSLIYGLTKQTVEYVFGDSVKTLAADTGRVLFESGRTGEFDIIVGADGVHSTTRRLAFGLEQAYHRYLGCSFVGFSSANPSRLSHEVVMQNTPGRMVAMFAVRAQPRLHVLAAYYGPQPPPDESTAQLSARIQEAFAGFGGHAASLLATIAASDDLYSDTISQIRMPTWVSGRVVLLGDAGYAPSFFSGQGTSLALTGAYVLAGELAANPDPAVALQAYQRRLRHHVARNQQLATAGRFSILPRTRPQLWLRNLAFERAALLTRFHVLSQAQTRATSSLTLPEYPH
jgi:2-polyprenyl-6-methoxyphenol hydroxylase-like FAD-dependent oxidoreductase